MEKDVNVSKSEFLVVVDVQPGYFEACYDILPDIIEKMNTTDKKIIMFYVGRTLGLDSKDDVIGFLLENGIDEPVLDKIRFVEKEYGYFRDWMDKRVDQEITVRAVQIMHQEKINNSKYFTDQHWNKILKNKDRNQRFIFEEHIYAPNFDNRMFLKPEIDNFELIGGSRYECLEEIDIYLKALGKNTTITDSLCYGADSFNPHYKNNKKKRKH